MKRLRIVLVVAFLAIAAAVVAFVVWARDASRAEPIAYTFALENPSVVIETHGAFITIRPASKRPAIGLLFYPGARVSPEAYVAKLSAISTAAKIQISIGRPRLNLAVFSITQADEMRGALAGVTRWYIGGHSLGGAMACHYASWYPERLEGVLLFGTYCGSDISKSTLRVLSITGENDGVMPPDKISQARSQMPAGARMIQVPGMNHAQFGNYGPQAGDGTAAISDASARVALSEAVENFFQPH
jgi:predicted esterase